jgi:hypothetical protein
MIGDSIHGRVDGGETTGAREDSGQPSTGPLAARPACRYRSFRDWGGAEAEYGGPPRLGSDGGRRSPITHVDGHGTAPWASDRIVRPACTCTIVLVPTGSGTVV